MKKIHESYNDTHLVVIEFSQEDIDALNNNQELQLPDGEDFPQVIITKSPPKKSPGVHTDFPFYMADRNGNQVRVPVILKKGEYIETRRGMSYCFKTDLGDIWNDGNGGPTYFIARSGKKNKDYTYLDDHNLLERLIDVYENQFVTCPRCKASIDGHECNPLGYCEDCKDSPLFYKIYSGCSDSNCNGLWSDISDTKASLKTDCPKCKKSSQSHRSTLA